MTDAYVVTLDIDWAPDFIIDEVAGHLVDKGVKATWFLTHDSPAVRRLLARADLFECALHPNFLPDSTQGTNEREVIGYLRRIIPDTGIMRSHALLQSTPLLTMLVDRYGIDTDVSLLMPGVAKLAPHLVHFKLGSPPLLRIPYFWEDDLEMNSPQPCWSLSDSRYHVEGLKIFDFHPIHVYMNNDHMEPYERLKKIGPLETLDRKTVDEFVNRDLAGTQTIFLELLEYIAGTQEQSFTIGGIARLWRDQYENSNTR